MRLLTKRKLSWFYGALFVLIANTTQSLAQPDLAQKAAGLRATVTSVHISSDGRYLVVRVIEQGLVDGFIMLDKEGSTLRLWDVATGKLQWEKKSPINYERPLLFSPDHKTLLSYGGQLVLEGGRTRRATNHFAALDVATGENRFDLELVPGEQVGSLVFTPDGKSLVGNTFGNFPGPDGQKRQQVAVKTWDSATGKLVRTIGAEWKAATSGDWALAGNLIASRGLLRQNDTMESTLFVWALPDLSPVSSLVLGKDSTSRLAFSPDGKRVAFNSYSNDNLGLTNEVLNLWNIEENSSIAVALPPDKNVGVRNFGFSPDGKTLIGSGISYEQVPFEKTQFWFWDAQTGELKQTHTVAESSLEVGEYSPQAYLLPDGKSYLLFGQDKKPELRSLEDKALIRVFE